jgi:uncharacterized membrane protein YqjE
MAAGDHSGGLFSSVRRVADTCVSSIHNRVELLSVELQEEKLRLVRLILWTGAALFAAFLAITVSTIAVVMLFEDDKQRKIAIIGFGAAYAVVAVGIAMKLRGEVRNAPPPLADTLSELRKDLQSLRSGNDSNT